MSHLALGEPVPDFALVNHYGETVRRDELLGAPAVLVFFPLVLTPVCEGELGALAAREPAWRANGVRVLGISVDHRYALRDAADRVGVGFDLLSDFWPHGAVAAAFGCFDPVRGHATRHSFVLDAAGRLSALLTSDHGSPRSMAEYEAALAALA